MSAGLAAGALEPRLHESMASGVTGNALRHELGRLHLALGGSTELASIVRAELTPLETEIPGGSPNVSFDFVRSIKPLSVYSVASPVKTSKDAFQVDYAGLNYHVEGSTASLRVSIAPAKSGRREKLPISAQRFFDWNYLSVEEIRAKNFMYGVFDYLTHIAQLQLGQSYIHASSLERGGEGTAIVAWGGIGKTSAALKLITEHGFNFLSDDLGLVDDAGTVWRTPKRLQVYAYNLEGEERLRSMLLDGRSVLDRASWAWKLQRRGPKGVRRRVSAEELFGERSVARSAPLKRVFCLERGDAKGFETREISTDELTHRAAEVVMHEIEPFGLLSRALHSGHHAPLLPTQDEVVTATRAVLRRAFDGIPVLSIRIPLATPPSTLANYLLSLIEK